MHQLPQLTADLRIALYRDMLRLRVFEQHAHQQYQRGRMGGWLFLTIGQEAVSIGIRAAMGLLGHSTCGHRCLGCSLYPSA